MFFTFTRLPDRHEVKDFASGVKIASCEIAKLFSDVWINFPGSFINLIGPEFRKPAWLDRGHGEKLFMQLVSQVLLCAAENNSFCSVLFVMLKSRSWRHKLRQFDKSEWWNCEKSSFHWFLRLLNLPKVDGSLPRLMAVRLADQVTNLKFENKA